MLQLHGGSPIGNSRVKLTNVEDCVKRGLVVEGENPLHRAAEQLMMDQVTILHTIGGDDTNTQAAKIAEYLEGHNYPVTVVGMPKTIDNDVVRSRRPAVLRCLHAIDATRFHLTRPWVVSFSNLRQFGPTAMLSAQDPREVPGLLLGQLRPGLLRGLVDEQALHAPRRAERARRRGLPERGSRY